MQSRCAAGSTHMGRTARTLRQRLLGREVVFRGRRSAYLAAIAMRSRQHTSGPHGARSLRQRLLGEAVGGRAVASRGWHSPCSSHCDRKAPSAAHTLAVLALCASSASTGWGGRSRRAGGTARALPTALVTRRRRHTHGPQCRRTARTPSASACLRGPSYRSGCTAFDRPAAIATMLSRQNILHLCNCPEMSPGEDRQKVFDQCCILADPPET